MIPSQRSKVTVDGAVQLIREHLSELLEMEPSEIEDDMPLSAYGVDSKSGMMLLGALEKWTGVDVDAEVVLARPSSLELATAVVAAFREKASAADR
jgi:acyl carrier protein